MKGVKTVRERESERYTESKEASRKEWRGRKNDKTEGRRSRDENRDVAKEIK